MALKVYWTVRADETFNDILQYLQNEWGEQTTYKFVRKVYSLIETREIFF